MKGRLTAPQTASAATVVAAAGLPKLPDFSAFGGVEEKMLTRLQQVSIPQLSLNNFIPQVTQFDLADITELEAWRSDLKGNFKKEGISLTIMAFIIKAVAHLLKEERDFAGHLADDGKSVLLRNEIHMGIAVARPDGLTVPVLRNPDQKSIKADCGGAWCDWVKKPVIRNCHRKTYKVQTSPFPAWVQLVVRHLHHW